MSHLITSFSYSPLYHYFAIPFISFFIFGFNVSSNLLYLSLFIFCSLILVILLSLYPPFCYLISFLLSYYSSISLLSLDIPLYINLYLSFSSLRSHLTTFILLLFFSPCVSFGPREDEEGSEKDGEMKEHKSEGKEGGEGRRGRREGKEGGEGGEAR